MTELRSPPPACRQERRLCPTRRDAVDAHAFRRPLHRERLRQVDRRGLGRAVARCRPGLKPTTDTVVTIAPPCPAWAMAPPITLHARNVPVRWLSRSPRHSSSAVSSIGCGTGGRPAQHTRPRIGGIVPVIFANALSEGSSHVLQAKAAHRFAELSAIARARVSSRSKIATLSPRRSRGGQQQRRCRSRRP